MHVMSFLLLLISDTEKFYTEVQEKILARYNKTFDWSLKAKMMGMKAIEAAQVFVHETGISDSLSAEDFLVEREDMLRHMFPTSELMPGIIYCSISIFILLSLFFCYGFDKVILFFVGGRVRLIINPNALNNSLS